MAAPAPAPAPAPALNSQDVINNFWKTSLGNGSTIIKPPSVLPANLYTQMVRKHAPKGIARGRCITESYHAAVKECEARVAKIVADCTRTNTKYNDPHFDLDDMDYCLVPLIAAPASSGPLHEKEDHAILQPGALKGIGTAKQAVSGNAQHNQPGQSASAACRPACARRVGCIFDNPQFYVTQDAYGRDICQGAEGDCCFISSLRSLCVDAEIPHLIAKICPPSCRDETIGVYGFVFSRDGEWVCEIIDDKLYMNVADYDSYPDGRRAAWDASHSELDPEARRKLWKTTFQRNSDALYYASSVHPQETWVPLIEKAFAKAHGGFEAIDGGWPGEGIEDLTGGITTVIASADVLDRDQLWNEGFLDVNKEFLFGASASPRELGRHGIEDDHTYSILRAVEYGGERLLMVRNPWGQREWKGPWSDGSKEWTAKALQDLDYKFGKGGIFWMPYEDFLGRFVQIWHTRLFTPEWNVSQRWTTIQVPWSGAYNPTRFEFTLIAPARTMVVLSQLDSRYFGGLTGQYSYKVAFSLHSCGETSYMIRGHPSGDRSAVAEVDLEPGTYEVRIQVQGRRDKTQPKIEDVIEQNWLSRRDKLIHIGLSYDLAHAKGQPKTKGVGAAINEAVSAAVQDPNPSTDPYTVTDAGLESVLPTPGDPENSPATDPTASAPTISDDTWNAPLVIGLRVFCLNTKATIKLVDPKQKRPIIWMKRTWRTRMKKRCADKAGRNERAEVDDSE